MPFGGGLEGDRNLGQHAVTSDEARTRDSGRHTDIVPHPTNGDPIRSPAGIARLARCQIHVRFPTLEIT